MINFFRKLNHGRKFYDYRTFCQKVVPRQADVVVIGGGSAGCHTLYHLAKRGVDCLLLERCKVTAGTTWHTAGLVWSLRPNDVDTELLKRSRMLLSKLEKETGVDPGWIQNGGLFLAHSKVRLDEYKRLATLGRSMGIESHILSPEETQKLFPLLNPKSFTAALYSPGDGCIDPSMLCNALSKGALTNGAHILEGTPATEILVEETMSGKRKIRGVSTPDGIIRTSNVVNATGVWGNDLLKKLGITLPLVAMKHAYVISDSIPEARGLPNIRDHDYSIYFRIQGESLCMGGYENNPEFLDENVPSDFNFGLYDLDWSIFDTHIKGAVDLCPVFEQRGIKNTICGPESFTPDHKPLMGPDPNLLGLYHNCGFNSAGMMFGGGCGEQAANWIIDGKPDLHMFNFDVRRYLPQQCTNAQWVRERSHESYCRNYALVFERDQRLSGRNFIKDPLHDDMIAAGAVMEEKQGWERPGFFISGEKVIVQPYDWYGNYGHKKNTDTRYEEILEGDLQYGFSKYHDLIGKEALACRTNAVVFDMSYFCKMFLTGPEAEKAVDWLFTANVNKDDNKTTYTCVLNDCGGVEADVTVTRLPLNDEVIGSRTNQKSYYIVGGGAIAFYTYKSLRSAIKKSGFNANLQDITQDYGIISVQGPRSQEILQKIMEDDLSNSLPSPYDTRNLTVKGKSSKAYKVRVIRLSFVGELGYELHVPKDYCSDIYKLLMEVGKEQDLMNAGYRALYSLSSEKGYHLWGHDLRADDTPVEANLTFCCRKNGTYRGKSTVDQQRTNGVCKKMVFLAPKDKVPLWGLEGVYRNGEPVGYLRRGEYAYYLDRSFGQAYIKRTDGKIIDTDFLKSGSYQIDVMGKLYDADCYLKSPFDPKSLRLLGQY